MTRNRILLAFTLLMAALLCGFVLNMGPGLAQDEGPIPGARPSPTPDGLAPVPPAAAPDSAAAPEIPPMPDLIVERIEVIPASPVYKEEALFRVTIKNQGTVDLEPTNTFYTDLYIDPGVVPIQLGQDSAHAWGVQAYWVPAGGSYTLEWTYVFTDVKVFALYAQVDTDNHVIEANEGNNVLGPVSVLVRAPSVIVHDTHEDFQDGLASTLDTSHPEGVIRPGLFIEPSTDPEVYFPDTMVNFTGTTYPEFPAKATPGRQSNPALTGNNTGTMFAIWEDGRNGDVYNRDIFFSRGTPQPNGLYTWSANLRVNQDSTLRNQVSPDMVWDPTHGTGQGRLYAVWADGRKKTTSDNNYDIYFAYSDDSGDHWVEYPGPLNQDGDESKAAQLQPSIAIGPRHADPTENSVYVVWQDRRNGNEDIYLSRSEDGGVTWSEENYFVTDDPQMTLQDQVQPSVSVERTFGHVYVAWEDWRDPLHPEIYVMRSFDQGVTFGLDTPVTVVAPELRNTYRRGPTVEADTTYELVEHVDEYGHVYSETAAISVVHLSWQEGEGAYPDVYYDYAVTDWVQPDACPYPYELCFNGPQEVSNWVMDSAYVRPPDEESFWPLEPSWQGEISTHMVPHDAHLTTCLLESTEIYSKGLMIAWSDARPYDEWRYEIQVRRVASAQGNPKTFTLCTRPHDVGTVNSNAKLHAYRDDAALTNHDSELYADYKPAATRQANPSIYVNDEAIVVAWDDDRWDDPLATGTVRNRDVFMARAARWDEASVGAYVSPVIYARSKEPAWYVLSWWGATARLGDLLLQTRFGKTPNPPLSGEGTLEWTAWSGNPSNATPGCPGDFVETDPPTDPPLPCYYDAPGRHIVDDQGRNWFDCPGTGCAGFYPYMQYRVTIKMNNLYSGRFTALSQVTVHYQGANNVYLPLVVQNY